MCIGLDTQEKLWHTSVQKLSVLSIPAILFYPVKCTSVCRAVFFPQAFGSLKFGDFFENYTSVLAKTSFSRSLEYDAYSTPQKKEKKKTKLEEAAGNLRCRASPETHSPDRTASQHCSISSRSCILWLLENSKLQI